MDHLVQQLFCASAGRKLAPDAKAVVQVRTLIADHFSRPADIASRYKISKSTLYKIVRMGA